MLIWLLISSMAISIWMVKLPVNMCVSARMSLVISDACKDSRNFLKAAAEQMFSVQNVAKISNLLATLDKYVETDLNTLTMLKAANSFKLFGDDKLRSCMLYGKFDDSSGVSYWNAEQADVNKSLDELGIPYLKDEEDTATEAEEEPKEHLQPKDRDELEKEAKFAEKASNN